MNDEDFEHAMDAQWAIGWSDIAAWRRGVPVAEFEDTVTANVEALSRMIEKAGPNYPWLIDAINRLDDEEEEAA